MLFCSLTKFCPCLGMNSGHEVSRLPSMVCFLLTSSENFFLHITRMLMVKTCQFTTIV